MKTFIVQIVIRRTIFNENLKNPPNFSINELNIKDLCTTNTSHFVMQNDLARWKTIISSREFEN